MFVIQKLCLIGSASFGFPQNTIHDFQNTPLNSKWHCLREMQQSSMLQELSLNILKQRGLADDMQSGFQKTFYFYFQKSLPAIKFYWRNDTHNLCHHTVFIPKSVRPRACSSGHGRHIILFGYCFKFLIPYRGCLGKRHIGVFLRMFFVLYSKMFQI